MLTPGQVVHTLVVTGVVYTFIYPFIENVIDVEVQQLMLGYDDLSFDIESDQLIINCVHCSTLVFYT